MGFLGQRYSAGFPYETPLYQQVKEDPEGRALKQSMKVEVEAEVVAVFMCTMYVTMLRRTEKAARPPSCICIYPPDIGFSGRIYHIRITMSLSNSAPRFARQCARQLRTSCQYARSFSTTTRRTEDRAPARTAFTGIKVR